MYQYAIGETYEKPVAELCKHGFHACEAPLDVWSYYPPVDGNRFCEVELDGVSEERSGDTKVTAKKITVGAELGIPGLVKAQVEWVKEHLDAGKAPATNTGDRSAATNTGDMSAATNTGDMSAATVGGVGSVAIVTGYASKARGGLGCAIVVVERGEWDGENYPLLNIKAALVDGETIKPDTWYTLKNGEFVEVDDEDA